MCKINLRLLKFICALLAGIAASAALAQELDGQGDLQREDAYGPRPDMSALTGIRFVTEGDYPPFNYLDEQAQLTGFNVDIARAICRELGVTCEIAAAEWDKIPAAINNKDADAAIASIAITQKSLAGLDFSDPYYDTPARFAARAGESFTPPTPESLDGRSVGVLQATAHEAYLRDFFPEAEVKTFASAKDLREGLQNGAVELIFADVVSLMFWVNGQESQACCQLLPGGFREARYFGEGVGIAVAKGNSRLKEILNYGLARTRASGNYEEIFLRYFPANFY